MSLTGSDQRKPKVSVVLLSYNNRKFVGEQIESIVHQTYSDWELIICDDGSSDGALGVAREFERLDDRIRVVTQERNVGILKNFESGILEARGSLVAYCNDDDSWLPDKLMAQVRYMDEHRDTGLVYHDSYICDENMNIIRESSHKAFRRSPLSPRRTMVDDDSLRSLLRANHIPGHTIMFRRELVPAILPFPRTALEDHWIALIAAMISRIGYIDRSMIKYRQHDHNTIGAATKGLKFFLGGLFSRGYADDFAVGARSYIDTLNELLERGGRISKRDETLIRDKIFCMGSILRLIGSPAKSWPKEVAEAAGSVIRSGQPHHLGEVCYFTLHRINPLKK